MTALASDNSMVGEIPVIDVGSILANQPDPGVSLRLLAASQKPGFIYIRNHGIPSEVIDKARASALAFLVSSPIRS